MATDLPLAEFALPHHTLRAITLRNGEGNIVSNFPEVRLQVGCLDDAGVSMPYESNNYFMLNPNHARDELVNCDFAIMPFPLLYQSIERALVDRRQGDNFLEEMRSSLKNGIVTGTIISGKEGVEVYSVVHQVATRSYSHNLDITAIPLEGWQELERARAKPRHVKRIDALLRVLTGAEDASKVSETFQRAFGQEVHFSLPDSRSMEGSGTAVSVKLDHYTPSPGKLCIDLKNAQLTLRGAMRCLYLN